MSAFVFVCKEYTKNFVTNLIDISHNDKNEQKLSLGYPGTEGTRVLCQDDVQVGIAYRWN